MKALLTVLLTTFTIGLLAQNAQGVNILIDGQAFEVESNKEFTYITQGGDSVKFEIQSVPIQQPVAAPMRTTPLVSNGVDFTNYKDEFVAFSHPTNFSIAKTSDAPGITQLTFVSGNGSGVVIQEFTTINPASLVDFLMQDLLNDYDASSQITRTPATIQSANNRLLEGEKATIITNNVTEEIAESSY